MTPEIDAIISRIASHISDSLTGNQPFDQDRMEALAKSLVANGWKRHNAGGPPLAQVLKDRVKEECPEVSIHRGDVIDGYVSQVQRWYKDHSRYQVTNPEDSDASERQTAAKTSVPRTSLNEGA